MTPYENLTESLVLLQSANRIDGVKNSYRKDNPVEYTKVIAYLQGGARPTGVSSAMGMGLMLAEDARRGLVVEPPPPPPPPPPGTVIDGPEDLMAVFNPNWTQPAVYGGASGGGMQQITTPLGKGMKMVCPPSYVTPWNSSQKVMMGRGPDRTVIGLAELWDFSILFPSQTFPSADHAGVLFQWHTHGDSSGHHLALTAGGARLRFRRQNAAGQSYQEIIGPAPRFNAWMPIRIEVKWSLGSDGYIRGWIDGTQYMNHSGQTVWAGEGQPYLQFGFYAADRTLTNEIHFSPMNISPL